MARQGHAFATADEVRVVGTNATGTQGDDLEDVPSDGKTLGEIITRGNIVMKGVSRRETESDDLTYGELFSTSAILKLRKPLSEGAISPQETWL